MKSYKASIATKNTHCRYCNSTKLTRFLSLGDQPPSNSFITPDLISSESKFPLDVYFCESCYLVQLLDVVSAEVIFDEYLYLSSSSKALKNHYTEVAQMLTKRYDLKKGDTVVDIGCNDGILLHGYTLPGLNLIGVEPSSVANFARQSGLKVYKSFFQLDTAKKIVHDYDKAKIITATNVFAHVDNIAGFVEGLPYLLQKDGVFVIEAPYLIDLIDKTLFDTIYHEHLCYLALTPMVPFLSRFGLEVFDVERIDFGASGPAIRVHIQHKGGHQQITSAVHRLLTFEKEWGIGSLTKYKGYAEKVQQIKLRTLRLMQQIRSTGAVIGGYGAPAKGNTLLNYFEITPEQVPYIAETNTHKQGLVTPGTHIPIISEEEFLNKKPEYAFLLTWNYLDFFLEKSEYIKNGGKFFVPLPDPHIVP